MKNLRQEFADTMLEVGEVDPRLVVMVGDISHGILKPFAAKCPGRYYNVGICEPTIVNMAAGLSKVGLVPVVHTIAPFIIERSYEQIKLDFGYQKLGVNLISVGGAFDYAQLGCSHHCYTDVSLIAHLKHSVIVVPGSPVEFNHLFKQSYDNGLINYFRLSEFSHGVEFGKMDLRLGSGIRVREGRDVTIAVTGVQLRNAMLAAETLQDNNISAEIIYFHSIKPFDNDLLRASVEKTKKLVSVEELSAHDGLFSLCLKACIGLSSIQVVQLAIDDFIHGYGTYEELCSRAGLTAESIVNKSLAITDRSIS